MNHTSTIQKTTPLIYAVRFHLHFKCHFAVLQGDNSWLSLLPTFKVNGFNPENATCYVVSSLYKYGS